MRFNQKKFLRQRSITLIKLASETKDAIVWDVLPLQYLCRVKIQGSNALISAYYPENWESTPVWLKPGNAVKIMHTGGNRGRIEVVGHGQYIPSPIADTQFPATPIGENHVISGCNIVPFPDPTTSVLVEAGDYMINGVTYVLAGTESIMGDGSLGLMGSGELMGSTGYAAVITINAPPSSGYYRFDLISVGTDGVVDYTAGTPSTTNPQVPALAANHLQLGTILVYPGMTEILLEDINRSFSSNFVPTYLAITIDNEEMAWNESTSTSIQVQVQNQYHQPILNSGGSWEIKLEFVLGNGTISNGGEYSTTYLIRSTATSSVTFTYTRNKKDYYTKKYLEYISPGAGAFVTGEVIRGATSGAYGYMIYDDTANDEIHISWQVGTFVQGETASGDSSSHQVTVQYGDSVDTNNDISPTLQATLLNSDRTLMSSASITLLNAEGEPMYTGLKFL